MLCGSDFSALLGLCRLVRKATIQVVKWNHYVLLKRYPTLQPFIPRHDPERLLNGQPYF